MGTALVSDVGVSDGNDDGSGVGSPEDDTDGRCERSDVGNRVGMRTGVGVPER